MRFHRLVLLPILIALAACSQPSPPPAAPAAPAEPAAKTEAPAAAAPSGQELNNAIQEPLDRARAVEDQLQQDKQDTDAALDQQGG